MGEQITLYRCKRCGGLGMGQLCSRGRCHGIPQEPGVYAQPIKGEPVEVIPLSTHKQELEGLAETLGARAKEYRGTGDDPYWNACSDALIGAVSLLRAKAEES